MKNSHRREKIEILKMIQAGVPVSGFLSRKVLMFHRRLLEGDSDELAFYCSQFNLTLKPNEVEQFQFANPQYDIFLLTRQIITRETRSRETLL
jgi:hypothetical protein